MRATHREHHRRAAACREGARRPGRALRGGWLARQFRARAVARHRSFNAIHRDSGFKVDVFVPPPDGFGRQQLARRSPEHIDPAGALTVCVATAEDVVIAKLDWYRASGCQSDRQWRDLVGVIKVQGPAIDREYLRRWAAQLEVSDLLERALAEAGPHS